MLPHVGQKDLGFTTVPLTRYLSSFPQLLFWTWQSMFQDLGKHSRQWPGSCSPGGWPTFIHPGGSSWIRFSCGFSDFPASAGWQSAGLEPGFPSITSNSGPRIELACRKVYVGVSEAEVPHAPICSKSRDLAGQDSLLRSLAHAQQGYLRSSQSARRKLNLFSYIP